MPDPLQSAEVETRIDYEDRWVDGRLLVIDHKHSISYFHIRSSPDAFGLSRTVELGDDLHVDIDNETGAVRGVECLNGEVTLAHLARVIDWLSQPDGTTKEAPGPVAPSGPKQTDVGGHDA